MTTYTVVVPTNRYDVARIDPVTITITYNPSQELDKATQKKKNCFITVLY